MKILVLVKWFLCILLYFISVSGYAQVNEVSTPKAGKLSSQLKVQKDEITHLTIQGEINGTDIGFIRSLSNLEVLDLTNARFVEGGKGVDHTTGQKLQQCNQGSPQKYLLP